MAEDSSTPPRAPLSQDRSTPSAEVRSDLRQSNVTVKREIDRIARQLGRMTAELKRVRDSV